MKIVKLLIKPRNFKTSFNNILTNKKSIKIMKYDKIVSNFHSFTFII